MADEDTTPDDDSLMIRDGASNGISQLVAAEPPGGAIGASSVRSSSSQVQNGLRDGTLRVPHEECNHSRANGSHSRLPVEIT